MRCEYLSEKCNNKLSKKHKQRYMDAYKLQILNVKLHKMLILYLYVQINNRFRYLWGHKKVKIVVKIILAAEMLTLEEALESCFKIKSILTEWHHPLADTINFNKTLTKRSLRVDGCIIRKNIEEHQFKKVK